MTTTEIEQILDGAEIIYTLDINELIDRLLAYADSWEGIAND